MTLATGPLGPNPSIGIAIAAHNEAKSIVGLLTSIESQTTSAPITVALADGADDLATATAARTWAADRALNLITLPNPSRTAPTGFNAAASALDTDVIIILGAHSIISSDFIERNIQALQQYTVDCSGGLLSTEGRTPRGRAIAAAMSSTIGVGNARFRVGGAPGEVDTVAFGAYRRESMRHIGSFDPTLVGAEDDEFNLRLTRAGGSIWFDPQIRSTYFCRDQLRDLWRQYLGYGRGKALVLAKHRRPPSIRMFAPVVLVVGLVSGAVLAVALGHPALFLAPASSYFTLISLAGFRVARHASSHIATTIAALAILHFSYGVGLLRGLAVGFGRSPRRR